MKTYEDLEAEVSRLTAALAERTRERDEALSQRGNLCLAHDLDAESRRATAAEARLAEVEADRERNAARVVRALAAKEAPRCRNCDRPATCVGACEGVIGYLDLGCDTCCGHGNEDGWCVPLSARASERDLRERCGALAKECEDEARRLAENATRLRRRVGVGAEHHGRAIQWAEQDERGADRETRFARALRALALPATPPETKP